MKNKFAIVVSEFNEKITEKLLEGAYQRLREAGVAETDISITKVPGAIEIPLALQLLAQSGQFSAVICLGAVIKGETDHYEVVCQQVSQGCQKVMLAFNMPVIFGVLTTQTAQQALDRVGKKKHQGKEAAEAALKMLETIKEIKNLSMIPVFADK